MERIFDWLRGFLSWEQRKDLGRFYPHMNWWGLFEGKVRSKNPMELSFHIQNMIDVLDYRKTDHHVFDDGLPKKYLIKIAEMLHLEVTEENSKKEIFDQVIKKIKEITDR